VPLTGIRVLDFTRHLPGPYATDLLRRLGADVIKVEPPEGDPTRWLPPIQGDYGALFNLVNGGKRSVVIDLKSDEGRRFAQKLATECDVAIESYRPDVPAKFGIDAETLMTLNPELVYCSISGFGGGNPRSGHDINFVALAGLLDLQRDAAGRPVMPATQLGDMSGALFAALSIVAALLERTRTGKGKRIDISMSDSTRAMMPTAEALYRGTHHKPESFMLTGALASYDVYRTSDGKYLVIAPLEPQFWRGFCHAIGHPEMIEQQYEKSARESIRKTITEAIASRTRAEWEEVFGMIDVCVEPVLSIEESHERFGDPVLRHPLNSNFPRDPGTAEPLGASFEPVAESIGLRPQEIATLKNSGRFQPRDRLQKFITTSVMKLTQRALFRKTN
jgi:crotonobetainyl-CoA:carnitine CoA-transferase CaiB-like acyl-CoA transferase